MARFTDETAAREAGFTFTHEPERHRFVLAGPPAGADSADNSGASTAPVELGEAHYTPLPSGALDFDHTLVDPSMRGTGLSGLLVEHALADESVYGKPIQASCWFVAGMLKKHPELAAPQG